MVKLNMKFQEGDNMWLYICSKKKYNEGELFGEIINLPADDSKIEEVVKKYSHNYQNDIAIHDYELPFEISEYENLTKVNEVCKFIIDNNLELSIISHIEHDKGEKITELSKEELRDYYFEVVPISASDKKEFCLEYLKNTGIDFDSIPDIIRNKTDWDGVFDELEISLCITRNEVENKFYYTHI